MDLPLRDANWSLHRGIAQEGAIVTIGSDWSCVERIPMLPDAPGWMTFAQARSLSLPDSSSMRAEISVAIEVDEVIGRVSHPHLGFPGDVRKEARHAPPRWKRRDVDERRA
jgi:hypothetical protein